MAYQTLPFRLISAAPLLCHNGQLADPLNDLARQMKKISGKRNKTDTDLEELARLEWYGSLYLDDGRRPCLPGEVLEAAFVEAAKRQRRGKQAQAGILCPSNYLLEYDGPVNLDELWERPEFRLTVRVRVKQNRVMRPRPRFPTWAATIEVQYDPALLNANEVREIVQRTGSEVGLGDWRPRFGRFEAQELLAADQHGAGRGVTRPSKARLGSARGLAAEGLARRREP
jgi:hypothetical protein